MSKTADHAITGEFLYLSWHRSKGPARLQPEHEQTWGDLTPELKRRWNRMAVAVRRKAKRAP